MKHLHWLIPALLLLTHCGGSAKVPTVNGSTESEPRFDICSATHDAQFRQRVLAEHDGEEWALQAVVEKTGCELQVLFLTQTSNRLLLLRQVGTETSHQYFADRKLPFSEENILRDVFRIFFAQWSPEPQQDGTRIVMGHAERYRDTYKGGALRQREVLEAGQDSEPLLRIVYQDGYGAGLRPHTVLVKSDRYGYNLRIQTQFLAPTAAP